MRERREKGRGSEEVRERREKGRGSEGGYEVRSY